MIYIYRTATGEIVSRITAPDDDAKHYAREGCEVITSDEEVLDTTHYYLDGFQAFPAKPSEFHTWDWANRLWVQNRALAEESIRAKRAALLNATVDKINAIRWAAMSEAERTAWDTYRTMLLDITEQTEFPFNVTWPSDPNKIRNN